MTHQKQSKRFFSWSVAKKLVDEVEGVLIHIFWAAKNIDDLDLKAHSQLLLGKYVFV